MSVEKNRHANQIDIFNPYDHMNKKILIIWAWWIGWYTSECLVKMWLENVTIVDFDTVENHNVSSQNFWPSQKGMNKVDALADNVEFKTGIRPTTIVGKYHPDMAKWMDIVIMAVDSMDVRREIVDTAKPKIAIIDGRMWWEIFFLYTFNPHFQMEEYNRTWFPSSEADPEKCTAKSVCYNTMAIASHITKTCKNLVMGNEVQFSQIHDLVNNIIS